MDTASSILHSIQSQPLKPEIFATCAVAVILLLTLHYAFFSTDEERPANFTISLPKQCKPGWQGQVLEEPAIKVKEEPIIVSSRV